MKSFPFSWFPLLLIPVMGLKSMAAEVPANFRPENLVPWCIVPFDSAKRGPEERAELLKRLGLKRSAYDWRQEHVATFEREILAYREHGIEFFAFWGRHEEAFALFQKHGLRPQIWQTLRPGKGETDAERVTDAANQWEALAKETARLGLKLGLYNHGGWGGEPENLVAVCREMRKRGHAHVGIVYNFHHAHDRIDDWAIAFPLMRPYLHCLNLNGMIRGGDKVGKKILPLAQGDEELAMIRVVIESGYEGPVGILDHRGETDTDLTLRDNLDGLAWLLKEIESPGSAGPRPTPRAPLVAAVPAAKVKPEGAESSPGPEFGAALSGGMVVPGKDVYRTPPITIECRARIDSKKGYQILVASDPKASSTHWELFTMPGSGRLTAYFPGLVPDHVRSDRDVADGRWHSVAMHLAPDRVRLWVDGEVVADQPMSRKPGGKVVPGGLAFGRLVEGGVGCDGAIDEVRITRGLRDDLAGTRSSPFGADSPGVLGYWHFDDLPKAAVFERGPLEPESNPYWRASINRDRIYDFYAKQARHYGGQSPAELPEVLPQFPGIDGGEHGHWGNQNDRDTWRDGRVSEMDHGPAISGVFRGAGKTIPRATTVALGGGLHAVFDQERLNYEVVWRGGMVKWSDLRRGFMQGTPMSGEVIESEVTAPEIGTVPGAYLGHYRHGNEVIFAYERDGVRWLDRVTATGGKLARVRESESGQVILGELQAPVRLADLIRGGPSQWPERLVTVGTLGEGQPYAIDTLALPHENPWNSLFFVGGIDFLPDGRVAICTIHGDVWLCEMGDPELRKLTWKRFAAGLHQPLGLKVSDGVIHVMTRDQITALRDLNGDDEADFYENVASAHVTSPGGHDFITGLERDDAGRWVFASGNQGVGRVSGDGREIEILATGFRNPNGLGITPDGSVVLTTVQEGDWTPASALCEATLGGHHGAGGPQGGRLGYVPPMLYLPRGVDNSSGGPTWIESERWGPVRGNWLHFSGGFCTAFLVLREAFEGGSQAVAVPMPGEFLSGAHRARFSPFDGQLYVAGAQGWGNYGTADGSLQRVRFQPGDRPFPFPIHHETRDNGILLTFADPVPEEFANPARWFAQQWNYRYGPAYGSPEYSVNKPDLTGHDPVEIRSVSRLDGGTRLFIEMPQLRPVDQLHLHGDASPRLELFATIHQLGEPFTDFPGYRAIPKAALPQAVEVATEAAPNPWSKGPAGRPVIIRAALGLQYETKRFTVKGGERISLTFDNPDTVPHNLVIGAPGSLAALGDLANRLMSDPKAIETHYVPTSERVLFHTSLLMPADSETIHFDAPKQAGEYPYLCTFPGHWMVMNGVMVVE